MTSFKNIRDSVADHLLTPQNAALAIIDFQPVQVSSIASIDKRLLVANVVAVAKTAKLYGLPIVLTTVNVNTDVTSRPFISCGKSCRISSRLIAPP